MRYLYFLILLTFSYTVSGQVSIINRSLTDSTLGYLYIGIDNAVEVIGAGDGYSLAMAGGAGTIQKVRKDRFIIRVNRATDVCDLFVVKGTKNIFHKRYKVRPISTITATIMGLRDTTAKIPLLLANPFVTVTLPGCYWRHKFRVMDFQSAFVRDGDSTIIEGTGNRLSSEQIQMIKTLKRGDKIYFREIRAAGPDSKTQFLPSFWIKIE